MYESALKVYRSGRDPEKVFQERRWSILQRLPTLAGWELQRRIDDLNEDLQIVKEKSEACQEAVKLLKQDKELPSELRNKVGVFFVGEPSKMIERFKTELEQQKATAKWIRRERQIYIFEQTKRKLEAAKLQFLRQQLKSLEKQTAEILAKMRDSAKSLNEALEAYHKTRNEYFTLQRQLKSLCFSREEAEAPRPPYMDLPVPELKGLGWFLELKIPEE